MWPALGLLLLAAAGEMEIDQERAYACVELSNEFILKGQAVGKDVQASVHPHSDTLKRISVDMVVYCYNHITSDLASRVLTGAVTFKDKEAEEVCKYRKSQLWKKDADLKVPDVQLAVSKRILAASQQYKKQKRTKSDL